MNYVKQQRKWLQLMSLFLILCWTIGAIWLINMRQNDRNIEDMLGRQVTIAEFLSTGKLASR